MKNVKSIKIIHIIIGLNQGGAEGILFKLLSGYDLSHCQTTVICLTQEGYYSKKIESLGIHVIHLGMTKWKLFLSLTKLYYIITKINPDIVQTWMYHANLLGGLIAKLAHVPKIIWGIRNQGTTLPLSTHLILKLGAYCSHWVPTQIVFCSKRAIDIHIRKGYRPEKVIHIPNGFNINEFKPTSLTRKKELRLQFNINPELFVFGMLGRFNYQKDYPNLLTAFSHLIKDHPHILLIICGKGLDHYSLTQLIKQLQLSDKLVVMQATSEPQFFYQLLDCFLLSSRAEGFPNVLGEAMSSALPCIATDVGDSAYLVGDTGYVVEKENAEIFSHACKNILNMPSDERLQLGRRARHRILTEFNLTLMVERFIELY